MEYPVPDDLPPYAPRKQLTGSNRAGIKYKSYNPADFQAAMRAVQEEGMSLRKASIAFNVPKTTLAEKLGDSCPKLPALSTKAANKVGTRYTFTEADMAQAIDAVQQGGATVSDAARKFGVPPSNLNSRVRGRPPKDLKGDIARLTLKQESLMAEWAAAQAALGVPPSKDDIYDLADKVVKRNGSEKSLGKQWVGHWLRRHPKVQARDWAPKPKWERKQQPPPPKGFATTEADESGEPRVQDADMMGEEMSGMVGGPAGQVMGEPGLPGPHHHHQPHHHHRHHHQGMESAHQGMENVHQVMDHAHRGMGDSHRGMGQAPSYMSPEQVNGMTGPVAGNVPDPSDIDPELARIGERSSGP